MINETLAITITRIARKAVTLPNSVSALFLPDETDIGVANGRLLAELQLFKAVQSTRTLQYVRAQLTEVWLGERDVSKIWVMHPCSSEIIGRRFDGVVALVGLGAAGDLRDWDAEDYQSFRLSLLPCLMAGVEIAKVG